MPPERGTYLDSWKEISAFLHRDVRTCQRWEKELSLPVHRLDRSPKARVFAYTDEIERWMEEKGEKLPPLNRRARRLGASAVALLVVAILGVIFWRLQTGRGGPAPAASVMRLVVLPFENMGAPEDGYFADGLTDEITARITSIRQLEVIGRSSAHTYKRAAKTPQQIGKELGVDYILSGTVRWQRQAGGEGQVRITPALIRASDGTQLWAGSFENNIAEIFRVQSDIAIRVSQALKITLRKPERTDLAARPTRDPAALDYFLRGREAVYGGIQNRNNLQASIDLFEEAIRADPKYVDAYAGLANSHSTMFWWFDHTEGRAERARTAAEMAIALGPETPEAHQALGRYYYLCRLDYDRALGEMRWSLARQPRNGEVLQFIGYIKRRQGKLDETVSYLQDALRTDPRDPEIWANLGDTYQLLRDYAESERRYRQAAALSPGVLSAWITPNGSLACLYLYGLGDAAKARGVLESVAPRAKSADDQTWLHYFWTLADLYDGRYEDASTHISLIPSAALDSEFEFVLKEELQARVYGLMGDRKREQDRYQAARIILAHEIDENPNDPRYHSALGIVCAGLGRKDEAVREASRAVALRPVSREFWRGIFRVRDLARVFVMVGDTDKALDRLEYLLSISGEFSVAWLKADPTWAPLRALPRFAALGPPRTRVDRGG